jgi:hypothetical protein
MVRYDRTNNGLCEGQEGLSPGQFRAASAITAVGKQFDRRTIASPVASPHWIKPPIWFPRHLSAHAAMGKPTGITDTIPNVRVSTQDGYWRFEELRFGRRLLPQFGRACGQGSSASGGLKLPCLALLSSRHPNAESDPRQGNRGIEKRQCDCHLQ